MELVIMAGGLGSRFGGLKQIEPIDENGNFIIDYSIFDAIRSGFDKVIFVIKKENFEIFENTIGKRIRPFIKVAYVFQEIPSELNRTKPLGTGHAVLITEPEISDKFAVINADDFYGFESFKIAKKCLESLSENKFGMVAFDVENTMSDFGKVKRGICKIKNNILTSLTECEIGYNQNKIFAKEVDKNSSEFEIKNTTPVSMNLWCFNKSVFNFLKTDFNEFCSDTLNLNNKEFFLPTVIENAIKKNMCEVSVFNTPSKWLGLTYLNDKKFVKNEIKKLINKNIYPENLWK